VAHSSKGRKPLTYQLQLRDGVDVATVAADVALGLDAGNIQAIDGGGADRNVDLPAEELAGSAGLMFWIRNTGATNNLVVRDDTPTTIATLTPGTGGLFACNGAVWVQVL
jgi:hypothetical protein